MNDPTPLLADFLTRRDAAKELGIHEKTLRNWAVRRYGPRTIRIGKRAYYNRADVRRWLEGLATEASMERADG